MARSIFFIPAKDRNCENEFFPLKPVLFPSVLQNIPLSITGYWALHAGSFIHDRTVPGNLEEGAYDPFDTALRAGHRHPNPSANPSRDLAGNNGDCHGIAVHPAIAARMEGFPVSRCQGIDRLLDLVGFWRHKHAT
jgi:hypothetical protein